MPNVGGPSQSKRQLLMSVVHSKLLYGAEIWSDSIIGTKKAKVTLSMAQRTAALRVARFYRTVSDMAALVLARMPPAHLLALKQKRISELRRSGAACSKAEQRRETVRQWQSVWESTTTKVSLTKVLIPDVIRWWYRGPKEVTFNMAQALTRDGCFQKYLWGKQGPDTIMCTLHRRNG